MYRVTDLGCKNEFNSISNFYDLEEAKSNFNSKLEKGLKVILETVKFKVLICDRIIKHQYPGYDTYITSIEGIDFITQSLLLGSDHIELYKVTGTWKDPQEIVDVVPLLKEDYSVESILFHGFNKLYPQSSFLSRYLVDLLDEYEENKIDKDTIIKIIDNIKSISFCKKQKDTLCEIVLKFIDKIDERIKVCT